MKKAVAIKKKEKNISDNPLSPSSLVTAATPGLRVTDAETCQDNDNANLRDNRPDVAYEIGRLLRQTRTAKGLTLEDVHQNLMISPNYLQALEAGHFEKITPEVYLIGFLKAYARYLGLDERVIRDKYAAALLLGGHRPHESIVAATVTSPSPLTSTSWYEEDADGEALNDEGFDDEAPKESRDAVWLLLALIGLISVVLYGWYMLQGSPAL